MIGVFRHAGYRVNMPIHCSDKWLGKYLRREGREVLIQQKLKGMNAEEEDEAYLL